MACSALVDADFRLLAGIFLEILDQRGGVIEPIFLRHEQDRVDATAWLEAKCRDTFGMVIEFDEIAPSKLGPFLSVVLVPLLTPVWRAEDRSSRGEKRK